LAILDTLFLFASIFDFSSSIDSTLWTY
jgi:hypothetical protein